MKKKILRLLKNSDIHKIMAGMFLLEIGMGFVVMAKGGNMDSYLTLFLPLFLLEYTAVLFSAYHGSGFKIPVFCSMLLTTGIGMQCIIQKENVSYAGKELIILLLSTVAAALMILLHKVVTEKIRPERLLLLIGIVTAVIYTVLLVAGTSIQGTKAWIHLGFMSLQPTEWIKILFIYYNTLIFCCMDLSDRKKFLLGLAYMAENLIFSAAIRELGSFMLMGIIFGIYCILFLRSVKFLAGILGAGAAVTGLGAVGLFFLNKAGRGGGLTFKIQNRIMSWLHPELDPLNTGFQGMKAREAMSLGGWFGSSRGVFIPVEESDFIFVSVILHLGVIVALVILLLFVALLVEGIRIYLAQDDRMHVGILAGCTYYIFIESILMILGSTGFFMMTGVPIAFISDGGTALMTAFMMAALIMYLGHREPLGRKEKENHEKISKRVIRAD